MPAALTRFVLGLIALLGVVQAAPAAAAAGNAGIAVPVCVAVAGSGIDLRSALTDPRRFTCGVDQPTLGSGDFWVRSNAIPAGIGTGQPLHVRFASVWLESVTLYAHYADGRVLRIHADDRGVARAIQLGAIIELPLPARPARLNALVWHIRGAPNVRGLVIGARVATPAQSTASNLAMGAIYAAFAGLALALLTHNLALWRALRQRFQLHYIAMLVMLMVYALSASGALAWAGADIANTTRLRVNYLSLALAGVAAIGFARHFFEPRIFAGWLGRAATLVGTAMAGSALLFVALAPFAFRLLDRLYALCFVAIGVLVVPMLWRAWRLRSDYRWLFGLAWAAPIALAAVRVGHNLGLGTWSFWLDNSTLFAMALEALISSLAIAYRVRQVARERDEARVQEIAARLLADTDPLTGVLNRRAFLAGAIGRADAQRLLILDLDHFKRVNDTIGHDGGDEVLRRIARLLRRHCPADGLVARLGGEEFAMLAPIDAPIEPQTLLAALRSERMPFDLNVTASIGVCTGRLADEADWKTLYRAADRALFEAKNAGRDRARLTLAA